MKVASVVYPHCQKVLPLVYDDSLSYYESICKLVAKINEVIEQFDDWSDVIAELQKAITDIDDMKSDISTINLAIAGINDNLTTLEKAIDSVNDYAKTLETRISTNEESIANITQMLVNFNTNVDEKLQELEKKLTKMINSINSDFTDELKMLQLKVNQMKVNFQSQLDVLRERMDNIDTSLINPWHSELGRVSPDKNSQLVYNDLADCVPLASEYTSLGLSADKYNEFDLTAMDYARRGKDKLHYYWVFSPVFGFRQEISNVLTSIVDYIKGTYTADEYAAIDMTADEYSALNMTAQEYYEYKADRQGVFSADGVLQSEQFALSENNSVLEFAGTNASETNGVLSFT